MASSPALKRIGSKLLSRSLCPPRMVPQSSLPAAFRSYCSSDQGDSSPSSEVTTSPRRLLQMKNLQRLKAEESSGEILISFHASGLSNNQWRKLKNLWYPGRTLFGVSSTKRIQKKEFGVDSRGPTCLLYLGQGASKKLELLPSPADQDLLCLVANYQSALVNHMDLEKASHLDDLETASFHFFLPTVYLSFLSSLETFNLPFPEEGNP